MRRLLALSLAAFATVGARSVLAEDAPTYTLPKQTTWKVGDVVSRTETEKMVQGQKVTMGEQVVQDGSNTVETAFDAVLAVKEVNDAGDFTKALVYFKSWKRTAGNDVDESLTGAHVEVNGAGATRSAKVVTPEHQISVDAAQWLDNEFGKGAGDREGKADEIFNPGKPVAVGETWQPELAKVREMFGSDGKLKFVDDECTAKLTLVSVEGKVATIQLEFDLPTAPLEGPGGKMNWTEGGTFVIRATIKKSLEAGLHEEGGEMTARLQGKAAAEGGVVLALDVNVTNTGTMKAGGEMPALAGAAATK